MTVTDANLFLGRLLPESFPKIFGPNEDEPLDIEATKSAFLSLAEQINKETGHTKTPEEIALGFIEVANESMAKPIRLLTEARGFDTSAHHLASFGGAGGQHACAIASMLSIQTVIIHRYSSILSAYGMALANLVHEAQEPATGAVDEGSLLSILSRVDKLKLRVSEALMKDGVPADLVNYEVYLNLRYQGTDNTLMVLEPKDGDFLGAFFIEHHREFGFTFPDRQVLIEDIRVRGIGESLALPAESPHAELRQVPKKNVGLDQISDRTPVTFASTGTTETPVFQLDCLSPGTVISGPAIIIDSTQTLVVEPGSTATILSKHVLLEVPAKEKKVVSSDVIDPVRLSVFGHRFMAIAEQMGRMFQKTSVSTNIKERLDFSCAVFSPDGKLVANAPHVPVHLGKFSMTRTTFLRHNPRHLADSSHGWLGSMEYAVRWQHERLRGKLQPGDHICTNHPSAGGTHLPDITIITPVWDNVGENIIFYVASRGHHAEIGGIHPGSMPSDSRVLYEEGAMTMGKYLTPDAWCPVTDN